MLLLLVSNNLRVEELNTFATQPSIQFEPGDNLTNHLHPNVEIKNVWTCTAPFPYAFMV